LKLTCAKCGYEWTPKVPDPKECPQCKSRYWREPQERRENMQCQHKIQHHVPETAQLYWDQCQRSALKGHGVCWQHTPEQLEKQAATAHKKATA